MSFDPCVQHFFRGSREAKWPNIAFRYWLLWKRTGRQMYLDRSLDFELRISALRTLQPEEPMEYEL